MGSATQQTDSVFVTLDGVEPHVSKAHAQMIAMEMGCATRVEEFACAKNRGVGSIALIHCAQSSVLDMGNVVDNMVLALVILFLMGGNGKGWHVTS